MKKLGYSLVAFTLISFAIRNLNSVASGKLWKEKLFPTAISDQFKLIGEAVNEPGYDIWGSSPVRDENGKLHLFCARWPSSIPFDIGWRFNSEIAHYIAEHPEGPFEFVEVVA
ncbi:MAG: hypothetical protein K0B15_16125, partial [Lentimicrobium sp.]|nr:hypothetical protein [Lentimicrobium sp.]